MSFDPSMYQPTDVEWMISKWAYNRICFTAAQEARSRPAAARRMVNRFLKLAKEVNYDMTRLHFDMAGEPQNTTISFGVVFRDGEIERVCRAGRFGPGDLLEVAVSLRGMREVECHEHN